MAGTERLLDFPVKATPVGADIIYVGDSADSYNEVQATITSIITGYSAALASIAGLTTSADQMLYTTGSNTYAVTSITAFGRSLLDDSTASAARTTLGLVIGTDVQAYNAALASIAGLTTAADKMIYTTASNTYAVTDITSRGRSIVGASSATAAIAALGLPTLTNGQLYIGSTGVAPVAGNLGAGPGISISEGAGTITISGTGSGIGWTEVTGTSQTMSADNGYVSNNAALVTLTLPTTAAFGTAITVIGKGAGGWKIAQNSGQQIRIGSSVTTAGVGGNIASTNAFDSIELICTTANTVWTCMGGPQGNITVV